MLEEKTMKSSSTLFQDKLRHNHCIGKWVRYCMKNIRIVVPFVFLTTPLMIASIFILFSLNSPKPMTLLLNQEEEHSQTTTKVSSPSSSSSSSKQQKEQNTCDLFKGHWVASLGSSYYTNSSCSTIPDSKNCFKHGRKDNDFLKWQWRPEQCELPRFDPTSFLHIVRGKKMAFIGDSVARNHMDSLLCLLSQEETPKDVYKDSEDKNREFHFPSHNFSLMMIWSRFLIAGEERTINGSGTAIFDLHLDKVDEDWSKQFPDLDYAIISDGHWFFRTMYLHEGGKLKGCVYCNEPNVKRYEIDFPFRMAFRTTFKHINKEWRIKKNTLTVLRTFAPAHFQNGAWNNGGYCNRTSPLSEADLGGFEWKLRNVQIEEFERARRKKGGKRRYELLDVSRAMLMRADGHPGEYWGNKWMKGYSDCTHWCLPGPIDTWSEFLLALLKRKVGD